jgi:hypothetical protein
MVSDAAAPALTPESSTMMMTHNRCIVILLK